VQLNVGVLVLERKTKLALPGCIVASNMRCLHCRGECSCRPHLAGPRRTNEEIGMQGIFGPRPERVNHFGLTDDG